MFAQPCVRADQRSSRDQTQLSLPFFDHWDEVISTMARYNLTCHMVRRNRRFPFAPPAAPCAACVQCSRFRWLPSSTLGLRLSFTFISSPPVHLPCFINAPGSQMLYVGNKQVSWPTRGSADDNIYWHCAPPLPFRPCSPLLLQSAEPTRTRERAVRADFFSIFICGGRCAGPLRRAPQHRAGHLEGGRQLRHHRRVRAGVLTLSVRAPHHRVYSNKIGLITSDRGEMRSHRCVRVMICRIGCGSSTR